MPYFLVPRRVESFEYRLVLIGLAVGGTKFVRGMDNVVKLRRRVMEHTCVMPYTGAVVVSYGNLPWVFDFTVCFAFSYCGPFPAAIFGSSIDFHFSQHGPW